MTTTIRRDEPTTPMATQMEEEEEDAPFTPITVISNMGVAAGDVSKLRAAGLHSVEGLQMISRRKLADIKGISDAKADKIIESAFKIKPVLFRTAKDLQSERDSKIYKVTTGCRDLDAILGGGMESGSITELYGEFRTGKSQLALTMCVSSFLPNESGGGDAKAIFIDTEGTFRPERLAPIAERYGIDTDFVLDNVLQSRVYTPDQLDEQLQQVAGLLADEEIGPFRVLVVDSIIALYRSEYIGRGELAERQQRIGKVMHRLKKLAEEFNLAVIITNQVTADPGGGVFAVADAKKPVGGHIIAHASDTRIMLRKGKGEQRIAKIIDSPSMPEAEATFQITNAGIDEAKD